MGNNTSLDITSYEDESLMNQILGKQHVDYGRFKEEAEDFLRSVSNSSEESESYGYIILNHIRFPYEASPTNYDRFGLTDTEVLKSINLETCSAGNSGMMNHVCKSGCPCNKNLMRFIREEAQSGGGRKKHDSENLSSSESLFDEIKKSKIQDDYTNTYTDSDGVQIKGDSISTSELYKMHSRIFRSLTDSEGSFEEKYEREFEKQLENEDNNKRQSFRQSRHVLDSEEEAIKNMRPKRNNKYH